MLITYPKSHLPSEQFSGKDYMKWLKSLTPELRLRYEIGKGITSNRVGGIHGTINNRGIMELTHNLVINNLLVEMGRIKTDDSVSYTYKRLETKKKRGEVIALMNRLARRK